MMATYYQLLGLTERASAEEIVAAYQSARERATPEQAAELDRAYATLSDGERRRTYDAGLAARAQARPGVSRREILMAAGGALVGLVLIAAVWAFVGAGESAKTEMLPVGQMTRPAPEFALRGLGGGQVQLSELRGKVVLVNFWGTWCEPCKEELPALQAAYAELRPRGFEIVGVNLYSQESGGEEAVRTFLEPYGVTYPIALDSDGETARAFQISPIPTSYFIDPSGTIRFVKVGTLTAAEVRRLFEQLEPRAEIARP